MWSSCLLLPRQLLNEAHPEVLTICEHLKLPVPGQRLTPAAKDKVAKRVPAQDWSLIDPSSTNVCPQKSEGKHPCYRGGHNKQVVAISANGMKHLLAQVPHQELANAWLQVLPTWRRQPIPAPVPACAGAWVPAPC